MTIKLLLFSISYSSLLKFNMQMHLYYSKQVELLYINYMIIPLHITLSLIEAAGGPVGI